MIIGLTYDLRSDYLKMGYGEEETAEFDRDDTILAIEETLQSLGYETDRIGAARNLMARLASGDRWDLVFNIAEGLHGIAREAQVPAILDVYDIPYTFSDPMVMSLTLHKGMTKHVAADCGFHTPSFKVVEKAEDADAVAFDAPYFVKPVAEGTGKGITSASVVYKKSGLPKICCSLLSRYHQPVLVEQYFSGREFTVGILGTGTDARAIGTMEVLLRSQAENGVYSYENKENFEELVDYRLIRPENDPVAREAETTALGIWRTLGCRDAGRVDLRCDDRGKPGFLEVNPLAGLHPQRSDLPIICGLIGLSYRELISGIVQSALTRLKPAMEKQASKRCGS